jgi:phage-related protein
VGWKIEFYATAQGNYPVQEFIAAQAAKTQARILQCIDLLEDFGLSLGEPHVEKVGDVWELKVRTGTERYRILYFAYTGRKFILLHAFLKKTKKTPAAELKIAENRMKDYRERFRPS